MRVDGCLSAKSEIISNTRSGDLALRLCWLAPSNPAWRLVSNFRSVRNIRYKPIEI